MIAAPVASGRIAMQMPAASNGSAVAPTAKPTRTTAAAQRPHSMADPPPEPRPLTPPISKLFRINLWVCIIALIPESWRLDGRDAWSAAHAEGRAGAAGAGGGRAGVRAQRLCGDLDGRDRRGGGHQQADDLPRLRGQARAVRGDPRIGQRAPAREGPRRPRGRRLAAGPGRAARGRPRAARRLHAAVPARRPRAGVRRLRRGLQCQRDRDERAAAGRGHPGSGGPALDRADGLQAHHRGGHRLAGGGRPGPRPGVPGGHDRPVLLGPPGRRQGRRRAADQPGRPGRRGRRDVTAAPPAPASGGPLTHRQIRAVYVGLMLAMLVASLDQTIVATALPTIVGSLGGLGGLGHLSWVGTAYLVTSTSAAVVYGKVSDLHDRKRVFQSALVVFLVGSALAGMARSLDELIAFRALQGLGGGGLMALTTAVVADMVPPRQRGRYVGYIGGVLALATVAGPLLGGFFVDHLTWRWIFYVNLPVGVAAFVVIGLVLHLPARERGARMDWPGAGLLVTAVTCAVLVASWGGAEAAWGSSRILGLAAAAVLALAGFVLVERRTREPLLPLDLFANPVVAVTSAVGCLAGVVLFGSIVFLPLFLQVSKGMSATNSGLLVLPLMLGVLVASTGIGRLMQVLVLASQNAVSQRHLGLVTSLAQFFRELGGTFGVALFGAIFSARLSAELAGRLPGRGSPGAGTLATPQGSPAGLRALPPGVHHAIVEAVARSVGTVFHWAVPFAVAAFLLTLGLRELPLRDTLDHLAPAEDEPAS